MLVQDEKLEHLSTYLVAQHSEAKEEILNDIQTRLFNSFAYNKSVIVCFPLL